MARLQSAPSIGRTIVFDVGGTILLNGARPNLGLRSGKDNLTIAEQTVPRGIFMADVGSKWTGNNLILRIVTIRPNKDPVNPPSYSYEAFSLQLTNSVLDHVSGA